MARLAALGSFQSSTPFPQVRIASLQASQSQDCPWVLRSSASFDARSVLGTLAMVALGSAHLRMIYEVGTLKGLTPVWCSHASTRLMHVSNELEGMEGAHTKPRTRQVLRISSTHGALRRVRDTSSSLLGNSSRGHRSYRPFSLGYAPHKQGFNSQIWYVIQTLQVLGLQMVLFQCVSLLQLQSNFSLSTAF